MRIEARQPEIVDDRGVVVGGEGCPGAAIHGAGQDHDDLIGVDARTLRLIRQSPGNLDVGPAGATGVAEIAATTPTAVQGFPAAWRWWWRRRDAAAAARTTATATAAASGSAGRIDARCRQGQAGAAAGRRTWGVCARLRHRQRQPSCGQQGRGPQACRHNGAPRQAHRRNLLHSIASAGWSTAKPVRFDEAIVPARCPRPNPCAPAGSRLRTRRLWPPPTAVPR